MAQSSAKNSWKLDKVDRTRCTWPIQAKNRYNVKLANRRAPGVLFVLGFITYLFWHQKNKKHFLAPKKIKNHQVYLFSVKILCFTSDVSWIFKIMGHQQYILICTNVRIVRFSALQNIRRCDRPTWEYHRRSSWAWRRRSSWKWCHRPG